MSMISREYPFVEWGVLFRPDKEGQPRYARMDWVEGVLGKYWRKSNGSMRLAAHLCGERVNEVLRGEPDFLTKIAGLGFRRVQINATEVNGVDTSNLSEKAGVLATLMSQFPFLEFIIQRSDETAPLWKSLEVINPPNMSMLFDESKGTGVLSSNGYPVPPKDYEVGYAGGIGPNNIKDVLDKALESARGRSVWVDMESSLRSELNGEEVFDLNKCIVCVNEVCEMGLFGDTELPSRLQKK